MANATNYLEKKLVDHMLGKAAWTMPATVYLALFTANPTETGSTDSEVTGGGYARQAITSAMSAAGSTDGKSTNTAVVNFGPATSGWSSGTLITHGGIMDAPSGGNMLSYAPLDTPQVVNTNGNVQLPVGEINVIVE